MKTIQDDLLTKSIAETEDYNIFLNSLRRDISRWRADKDFPKNQNFNFNEPVGEAFYLWGDAGTGKTKYLEIFKKNTKEKITEINSLDQVRGDGNIYLFDAVNESKSFSEGELEKIVKDNFAFIIYAGWERSRIFSGHNIDPSEDIVLANGWAKLEKYNVGNHFSIREKSLMSNIKNYEEIIEKQLHSVMWKAFENIMSKPEIKYYKKLVCKDPLYIEQKEKSNSLFNDLLSKKIIQYSSNEGEYIFSHQNMVNYLFFRKYADKIKELSIEDDFLLEVIGKEPAQFINWWKIKKGNGDIGEFFVKNEISIRVIDHRIFDKNLNFNKIKYKELTFEDLCILDKFGKQNRIYSEFLNSNINTGRELSSRDIHKSDLVYFVYSIHSPIRGDDHYPSVMNSMKKTSFETKIKWDNSNNKYRMLNYILGRYIHAYINEDFSSLEASNLENLIYSNWDNKNKLPFKEFVVMHYQMILSLFNNNEELAWRQAEKFDGALNLGVSSSSVLSILEKYNDFDNFFNSSRNLLGMRLVDHGHKYVQLSMYLIFEKNINSINTDEMKIFNKQQCSSFLFDFRAGITYAFKKFMTLLTQKFVYLSHNEPVYDRKFDMQIKTLPLHMQKSLAENDIQKVYDVIREYLKVNSGTLNINWEIDKIISKNHFDRIWVRNYNRYSIYDPDPPKGAIYQAESVYDPSGTRFIIKDNQQIEISNKKSFDKYIVSYRTDSKQNDDVLDGTFLIKLKGKPKLKLIKYMNITSWNITDESLIDKEYKKAEETLLPIIKNTTKIVELKQKPKMSTWFGKLWKKIKQWIFQYFKITF